MATIASVTELKSGEVFVQLTDKRGLIYRSRAELNRIRDEAARLPLEQLVALAVPADKAQDAEAIGKDVTAVEFKRVEVVK